MDMDELSAGETMYEDSILSDPTVAISIYAVVLYVGVCTNIWLLWSLYKSWKAGSRVHFHLLALCISNLLVLATHWPIVGNWEGGNVGCKMLTSLKTSTAILAHLILAGFNIDNAITILCQRSYKAVRILYLIVAVFLSTCICVLAMIIFKQEFAACAIHTTPALARLFEVGGLVGIYFLPIFVIFVFGGLALGISVSRRGTSNAGTGKSDGNDTDLDNIGECIVKGTAINGLFILCLTPFAVLHLLFLVSTSIFDEPNLQLIYLVVEFLATSYSCLLPLVNGLCNYLLEKRQVVAAIEEE